MSKEIIALKFQNAILEICHSSTVTPDFILIIILARSLEVHGSVTFIKPLQVNTINGRNVDNLFENGVPLTETNMPPFKKVTINGDVIVSILPLIL